MQSEESISWTCRSTWKKASVNTLWCLLGCSIGDFGTILFFQITSIMLETFILSRQMNLKEAFSTAMGMSFISMIAMEIAMNTVDVVLVGGILLWWVIPIMLLAGFLTPLPYNYYRLKKYDLSCH